MENPEDIITIKNYYSEMESSIAKSILESNGIKCTIVGKRSPWLGSSDSELKVLRRDTERAIKILDEYQQEIK
ncbi:MAG: hypothetical protein WC926_01275 [Candidatus Paceibacterota bacterium]|jgi:hypothetical protein